MTANDVWAHYFPPARTAGRVLPPRRTEAERVWGHFAEKEAAVLTYCGLLMLASVGAVGAMPLFEVAMLTVGTVVSQVVRLPKVPKIFR